MGTFFILLGIFMLGLGAWGLVMGTVQWARIRNRRTGAGVILGSLFTMLVGGALSPQTTIAAAPVSAPRPTATVTVTVFATPPTVTVTPATVTITPEPVVVTVTAQPEPTRTVPESVTTSTSRPTIAAAVRGTTTGAQPTRAPAKVPTTSVYYKNCDAARAAGAAPIRRGQPGYRAPLDRDDDGIACE